MYCFCLIKFHQDYSPMNELPVPMVVYSRAFCPAISIDTFRIYNTAKDA